MNILKKELRRFLPTLVVDQFHDYYTAYINLYLHLTQKVKRHMYEGYLLDIYIFDQVSKLWYDHDWERGEIDFLRKFKLKPNSHVFNIGAHHGVVALIFSKIVENKGSIVAVEMDKRHIKVAKINKKNNNAHNLNVVHAAVAAQSGRVRFAKD